MREAKVYDVSSPDVFFFVQGGSFTLHLVRKTPSPATGSTVIPVEASSGRAGVRIASEVLEPTKVDHFILSLAIDGAPATLAGAEKQKVARGLATLLNIVSSRVLVEPNADAHDKRRREVEARDKPHVATRSSAAGSGLQNTSSAPHSTGPEDPGPNIARTLHGPVGSKISTLERALALQRKLGSMPPPPMQVSEEPEAERRHGSRGAPSPSPEAWQLRTSQTVTFRIWCGSPSDVDLLAQQVQSLLKAGALTVTMQLAGLMGQASLDRLSVFRCGVELECVALPPETPVITAAPVETTPVPPPPFPLMEVILVSGTVVLPLVLVLLGVCVCVAVMWVRRKRQHLILRSQVA
jgi:hypothetical protein